jgi:hypothetical protein
MRIPTRHHVPRNHTPRRPEVVLVVALALASALTAGQEPLAAAELTPEALSGWQRYAATVEQRRGREVDNGPTFLVLDTARDAADERRRVLAGQTVIRSMDAADSTGRSIDVPDALVHHWRGAVFLRGATLDSLLSTLETEAPPPGGEVLRSAVLARAPQFIKVFLRIERSKVVTVVLDTEHVVHFNHISPTRASSASIATRIVEVENPGTPGERALAPGADRGFLWRLNAYWRYEAVPGGVIAECESISLSRRVPFGLQTIASPIIGGVARESMERALADLVARTGAR